MNLPDKQQELKKSVQSDVAKMEKAKKEKFTLLAQTIYLGTLGFMFVLPVIVGAYLGVWLDNRLAKYFSISWTISLIFLGVMLGVLNVYLFIRKS